MKLMVLAVGRPRDRHMSAIIDDYETRARRYFRFEAVEVSTATRVGDSPTATRIAEGQSLAKRIPKNLETWALTRDGNPTSSRDFAEALANKATYGQPGVAFLIGGAFGLDDELVRSCSRTLSLSSMTLPHELARLVLAEQIYRAGTILRGEPYHKGGAA
ncbi:MAG: 23S rRNA (pseudouridine(1915)-N(3))-methyltransferase RlmH [Gemmatimonadetes bacterium]|nr:23S rRNA (pseudouridine(1915)-N(3))-methyltransferase RlmH [Gemmatimonadota bacterium]MBT8479412.1 23S rRNA (pseudouridine(1915)-N(3))-methyltransferase RlmH [Gemmatimonadota bacterium]NNK49799.1 23S rRNA (pseudouridine(1915)-N(3))-methyltransferase RlmH [Gemmatimonadota bacterium]